MKRSAPEPGLRSDSFVCYRVSRSVLLLHHSSSIILQTEVPYLYLPLERIPIYHPLWCSFDSKNTFNSKLSLLIGKNLSSIASVVTCLQVNSLGVINIDFLSCGKSLQPNIYHQQLDYVLVAKIPADLG